MADSLTEFLGLLAHSKECKGFSRRRSRKGVVDRQDIGIALLDHVRATLGQKAPEPLKVPDQTQSFVNVIGRGFSTLWTRLTAALP